MSNTVLIISAIVMLVLLFLKVPVFISILFSASLYFIANPDVSNIMFAQRIIASNQSTTFLAVPFFAAAGALMNCTGVTRRIMEFCKTITGRMCGGLAQVNVLLSTLMGGLSGSNIADAAMEAKLLVPEMEKAGYSKAFSSALTATSAIITPLIPPGIAMILYGCIAQVSIGKLFMAGIGIGILLCVALMITVHFMSKKRGYMPIREQRLEKGELWKATKPAIFPLMLPIIIIGGIRIGIFTASEAGAMAIVYALILGFCYKEMNGKQFWETSVYKGYKQDKIEMRGDRAEMSDFPLYLNTVAGGLDRRDQTIGGFSFVVKIYALPVVEIIGQFLYLLGRYGFNAQIGYCF